VIKRILLSVPALGILLTTSLIFMGAHAPRTWAAHWSTPVHVSLGTGQNEYGAIPDGRGWDLLWVNDDLGRMMYTVAPDASGPSVSTVLDRGDVAQPTLIRFQSQDVGAWIHQRNGGSDLYMALLHPHRPPRVVRLLSGPQPMEHPQLFRGPHQTVDLVFSWQRYGNFDLFLLSLPLGSTKPLFLRRLTVAKYYSFYPRAVLAGNGSLALLHLESCCQQQAWNVSYDRFDASGRHLGRTRVLQQLTTSSTTGGSPSQWGEDIGTDPRGNVWGAFTGSQGVYLFEARADGTLLHRPHLLTGGVSPEALSLLLTRAGGYVFWEEPFDLGTYLDSQRFDTRMNLIGAPERVVYESASQTNPHAFPDHGTPVVLWQSISRGLTSRFETAGFRRASQPSLAERLGLGLGDPWGQLAILVVSAFGIAVLTTVVNILAVFGLAVVGLFSVRLFRRVPGKWALCGVLLTAGLYVLFVDPGAPTLFLSTIPAMGLTAVPFGLLACAGALAFVLWLGAVVLRRVEDLYRAGMMAALGVYFFAFVEAIVFIQQRIGYI